MFTTDYTKTNCEKDMKHESVRSCANEKKENIYGQ
jgi:hypothetical protein